MTTNIELQRSHDGSLHMLVAGAPAIGAQVTGIGASQQGELQAIVVVPLKHATFGEVQTVVPFVRAEAKAA